MLDYLEKLISFYPVSDDTASVKDLLTYVQKHFESRGLICTLHCYKGMYSLYASPSGNKHARVLLQAHVDVVPGEQKFTIKNDKCYGRGSYDMLFGTAAFMQLVDELAETISQYDIAVMLSGDEEKGGFNGVKALINEAGYSADVCILPDAGEGFGALNIAAKGVYQPTIMIHGRSHHGSRPWEGDGAASKIVFFLNELEKVFDKSDRSASTMTISRLQAGGNTLNQAPSKAETSLDIRYKDKQDLERIKIDINGLILKYDGEITSEATASDYQLDQSNHYVTKFIEMYEKHIGYAHRPTKAYGSSDARYFTEKGIPVIMLRPDGGGAHGDEEWISISSLDKFYSLLTEYVTVVATKV